MIQDGNWTLVMRSGGCILMKNDEYVDWFETVTDAMDFMDQQEAKLTFSSIRSA